MPTMVREMRLGGALGTMTADAGSYTVDAAGSATSSGAVNQAQAQVGY